MQVETGQTALEIGCRESHEAPPNVLAFRNRRHTQRVCAGCAFMGIQGVYLHCRDLHRYVLRNAPPPPPPLVGWWCIPSAPQLHWNGC